MVAVLTRTYVGFSPHVSSVCESARLTGEVAPLPSFPELAVSAGLAGVLLAGEAMSPSASVGTGIFVSYDCVSKREREFTETGLQDAKIF